MQTMLQNNSRAEGHLSSTALMRGITAGLIGGLVGTIVMDLFDLAWPEQWHGCEGWTSPLKERSQ